MYPTLISRKKATFKCIIATTVECRPSDHFVFLTTISDGIKTLLDVDVNVCIEV